ncbi:hypothetical protein MMC30_002615 [Trapelia coarctata]|nr:hypothetical protein [Trapelia coarctata]
MSSPRSTATLRRRVAPEKIATSQEEQDAKRTAAMRPIRDEAADALLPEEREAPPLYSSIRSDATTASEAAKMKLDKRNAWMVFAVASGTCAAFNGVFAKLTTTELTTSIAATIAGFLNLGEGNHVVDYLTRAIFFSLNLAFNALMWVLFTRALTLHTSTTHVSILNTSSNFLFTAILGLLIFSESLPPLWFLGAGMLVIGNVIIGRRDGEDAKESEVGEAEEGIGLMEASGEGVGVGDEEGGWKGGVDILEEVDDPLKEARSSR